MKLIPQWRRFWRMYSVWWIVALTLLAATSPFIDEIRAVLDLGLLPSILLTALAMLAGVLLRLVAQPKVRSDDDQ
ncbi:DUF7940 domain-containing protein [Metapseudomonas otitidis]|uniref:DUF7940 domain-containing protein n=1 Tax=Metapseudomonas otitidis TaxID=319939 RepID=UPI0013F5E6E2|nr:hypothetical protein [Pseudomonas otitidis]